MHNPSLNSYIKDLLSPPECSLDLSEILISQEMTNLKTAAGYLYTKNGVADPRKLNTINIPLICEGVRNRINVPNNPCDAVFYPFSGADTFYPTLLTGAPVTFMTDKEPWGNVCDIQRAMEMNVHHLAGKNNYAGDEDMEETSNKLGPMGVARAIAAQELSGRKVINLHLASFDGFDQDFPNFASPLQTDDFKGMAYWITTREKNPHAYSTERDSATYLYLFNNAFSPNEKSTTDQLRISKQLAEQNKIILKNINKNQKTLIFIKGIPLDGMPEEALDPKKQLPSWLPQKIGEIYGIISDNQDISIRPEPGNFTPNDKPPKIFFEGLRQQSVDLSTYTTAGFGQGNKIHVFTPPDRNMGAFDFSKVIPLQKARSLVNEITSSER